MKNLEHIRHSLAHLLAAAVMEMWPDTKRAIGPAINNGFYFDFEFAKPISDTDLPKIEKRMRKLLPTWDTFEKVELSKEDAIAEYPQNPYKAELIEEFSPKDEPLSFYASGKDYRDLCRGGHVESMKEIDPDSFKLSHVAGAYWRGDEKNTMLTRIYGVAFETKKELDEYLVMQEEAKKRDHKKLGKELELFTFSPLVGPGLPLFMPKGEIIKSELEQFVRKEKEKLGYKFVFIPHIAKAELYEKSGHLGKYDAMMPALTDEHGDQYVLKPMNCPHHFEIYNSRPHSYKDLPLRLAGNTEVYRNEKSGELSGLTRVKAITQDDTHHFVTQEGIHDEIKMILSLMNHIYKTFGFEDFLVQISVRDPKNPENYFGDDSLWKESENILIDAVKKWGAEYIVKEGEAAFYGPKIDIMVKDSIGRMWQLTTVQLDFNQPENFEMTYIAEDGSKKYPAVLHVAILGATERFMGILIEHYAGAFPLWLSPIQITVLPISEKHKDYADEVYQELKDADIRVELDDSNETLGKKIRNWKTSKTPYGLIIGDKEMKSKKLKIENRDSDKSEVLGLEELVKKLQEEITNKGSS